jgi:hypothetical protein
VETCVLNAASPSRQNRLRRQYGFELGEYERRLQEQGGVCAMCEKSETHIDKRLGVPRRLVVDHNHTTGKVRALLCSTCNLGNRPDDIGWLKLRIAYLEKHDG